MNMLKGRNIAVIIGAILVIGLVLYGLRSRAADGQVTVGQIRVEGPTAPDVHRALWVWGDEVVLDPKRQADFFDFCRAKRIHLVYLDIGKLFAQRAQARTIAALQGFLGTAYKNNLQVHALDGSPEWAYTSKHAVPLERLEWAMGLLADRPDLRFAGIQFDIEPYVGTPEFKAKGEAWKGLLRQYLDLARQLAQKVQGQKADFALGFAIPFWWDTENPAVSQVDWGNATKPAAYHLMDVLNTLPQGRGYIALMDYRDFAETEDGSIRHASDEMKYAQEHAPRVTVMIGQETGDVQGEPTKITFWQEGESALEKVIADLAKAFKDYPCFGGVAIHHYGSYRQLKPGGATAVTSTPAGPPPKNLEIATPQADAKVAMLTMVSGHAPTTRPGGTVALAVLPVGDIWYDQGVAQINPADGSWSLQCHFGNEQTASGTRFRLRAQWKDAQGNVLETKEVVVQRE